MTILLAIMALATPIDNCPGPWAETWKQVSEDGRSYPPAGSLTFECGRVIEASGAIGSSSTVEKVRYRLQRGKLTVFYSGTAVMTSRGHMPPPGAVPSVRVIQKGPRTITYHLAKCPQGKPKDMIVLASLKKSGTCLIGIKAVTRNNPIK